MIRRSAAARSVAALARVALTRAAFAGVVLATPLAGQAGVARTTLEGRLDTFAARHVGAQGGVGVAFAAGTYLRVAAIGGAGIERRGAGVVAGAWRVEGIARFHADPFRRARRGAYAGGGIGALRTGGERVRATLVAVVGLEGAPRGAVAPAIEVGVGGGARVGVVLRQARPDRR